MNALTAARVRQDVLQLKAWVEHWQLDSQLGLASTPFSLNEAHRIAVRAIEDLKDLERTS